MTAERRPVQQRVELGRRIREARIAELITQRELAERSGLGRDAIAKYETGARSISVEDLRSIAAALNTTAGVLLGEQQAVAAGLVSNAQSLPAEVQTIVRVLEQHPSLTAHILETIELLLEREIATETSRQPGNG
jgi:transcriptional regulator with XRE-family HTH domain